MFMIHTSSSLASAKIISRFSYDQNPFRSDKIFITTWPCPDRIKSLHVILIRIWKILSATNISSFNSILSFRKPSELGSLPLSLPNGLYEFSNLNPIRFIWSTHVENFIWYIVKINCFLSMLNHHLKNRSRLLLWSDKKMWSVFLMVISSEFHMVHAAWGSI